MGIIRTNITLSNPLLNELSPITTEMLVDTGALHLCLPQHLAMQLKLSELEKREVILANGVSMLASYVGPVEVRFENRRCFVGAMILGDEPLLGAIPMEDMDLIIHPARQILSVNPQSPNIPLSLAK